MSHSPVSNAHTHTHNETTFYYWLTLRHLPTNDWAKHTEKLAPYWTDGRLFTTDVSVNFKVTW